MEALGALVGGRSSTLMHEGKCVRHTPTAGGRGGRAGPSEDLVKKRQGTRALKAAQRLSIYWSVCFFPFLP